MKRFYIILLILSSFITAKAQMGLGGGGSKIVGRISGNVIDSVTKKPVDYASIGLYHSGGKSPITGVITDEKGNFRLDNIAAGNYKIVITFIGYPDKVIDPVTTTASKPDFNLGQIQFAPSRRVLKEVQITGQAALVENKIDKIVYNAEKDITAGGGSATDILQKVPLVSVDINGNVSLRGDQNVRVLINGKPSGATAASLSDVLKGIPADQIKSVEVITSPSAKYDAEGSAGIINIITKSKNISGLSGSVSGGVGTRQNNGNLNLNYKKNRFDFTVNVGGNAGWPQTSLTEFSQKIMKPGDTTYSHSEGTSRVTRHAVIGSLQAGYEFNAYNSISSTLRLNQIQFNTNSSSVSTGNLNYSSNTIAHAIPASGFDWSVDYTHKFKKEGEELDLSTQWTHSIGKTDFVTRYTGVIRNQKDDIDGTNNEYTLQLDYTLPINPVFKLETGGKYIMRKITADNNLYSPNGDDFIYNNTASNSYDYNQNVAAGYAVLTINLSKTYSILAGIRDEYTSIDGNPVTPAPGIIATSQGYNTFVPSLTLQKKLSATQTLKLAYSKRITRPSLQFLNPYTDSTNVQAQKVGNPALNAEVTQTIELDYNTFIGSSVLNFSAYYKHTAGLIEGIATPLANPVTAADSATTITKYQNIGNNNSWGGSIFGSVTPFKILTIMGNINAYTYKPDPTGLFIFDQSKNGTYIQYSGFLRGSLSLPHDLVAEAFAFGSSSRRTIQGSNPSFSMFGVGVKKQFDKKKWSLGVNAFQPFSNYKVFASNISSPVLQQSSRFQLPFRSFGLTFSYSFGKLSFSNPMQQQKKGVNNDDLKQGDQGMGGGGGR